MKGIRKVFAIAALFTLALAAPLVGQAAQPERLLVDGSAAGGVPGLSFSDRGGGEVAAVLISGGTAPSPCLEAAAEAVSARYRTIRFSLDAGMVADFGGTRETAALIARLIAEAGVSNACIVGCCSAAGLVADAANGGSAIRSAIFFGEPAAANTTPLAIPALYVNPSIQPLDLVGHIFELLGPVGEAPARHGPSGWRLGADIPQ